MQPLHSDSNCSADARGEKERFSQVNLPERCGEIPSLWQAMTMKLLYLLLVVSVAYKGMYYSYYFCDIVMFSYLSVI